MLKKGIILIATGAPGYGNMAYNLAQTIKQAEQVPVALVHDDTSLFHLTPGQLEVFDHLIPVTTAGFATKLNLDQLTPFTHTLYCDVDMLWLGRKPSELFDQLQGIPFTAIKEGCSDKPNNKYYFWADPTEIKKAYGIDWLPMCRSEVLYFEKGTKVFATARKLKPATQLKTIRMFGDNIPDELYFNIACGQTNTRLVDGWMPAYWSRLNGEIMPPLAELYKNYFMLSFGSNTASGTMKKAYDNIMTVCCNKLRLPYLFKLKSKKEWAPGRLKI